MVVIIYISKSNSKLLFSKVSIILIIRVCCADKKIRRVHVNFFNSSQKTINRSHLMIFKCTLVMLLGSVTREIPGETCPKVKLLANHQEN